MKNNKAKKIALGVAGVAIALLVIIIVYEIFRTKPVSEPIPVNLAQDPNEGLSNMINDIYDNAIPEEDENIVDNEVVEEIKEEETKTEEKPKQTATLSKEEQAKEMAKEEYGDEEGVYFSVDAIDSEGRYIVSVHESETTFMLVSYAIDIEKKTIIEQ